MPNESVSPLADVDDEVTTLMGRYRRLRDQIERAVLPRATSVDGRRFTFQASLHGLDLQTGGYVVLDGEAGRCLGQVLNLAAESEHASGAIDGGTGSDLLIRLARGDGIVLDAGRAPFHDAEIRTATSAEVEVWFAGERALSAALHVGELLLAPGVDATLDAGGFNRHTFMCGQSGSGKTYSLGLVLEQLLLRTGLRMVILDPNSDYVRLGEVRPEVAPDAAAAYGTASAGVEVWGRGSERPLRLTFGDLVPSAQAAILGLHPVADREEYAAMTALSEARESGRPMISGLGDLLTSDVPGARELGLRANNLGVLDWSVWSRGQGRSLTEALVDDSIRCLVVDLGSLDTVQEQRLMAQATLATLWRERHRREPVLIVIDEAHNVCPRQPADAVTALASETAALIAAEGRKFGLYLLASTQRPQKVNEEVLTQCDNLLLMRMNSEADLDYLREVFSFVPAGLVHRATAFQQGHCLAAGKFFPNPAFVRAGARLSEEGGADVATTWASGPASVSD